MKTKTVYQKTLNLVNETISVEETYSVVDYGDKVIHTITREDIFGNKTSVNILTVTTTESISEKCYLCDEPATHRIFIGNVSECYCDVHAASILKDLIIYKVASNYWNSMVKKYGKEKAKS